MSLGLQEQLPLYRILLPRTLATLRQAREALLVLPISPRGHDRWLFHLHVCRKLWRKILQPVPVEPLVCKFRNCKTHLTETLAEYTNSCNRSTPGTPTVLLALQRSAPLLCPL